jgi:5-methylcytosine-specific restriction endonuclease McrA
MEDYRKRKIPKAMREQLWLQKIGKKFESKCKTTWCRNKISVFDFQAGHDVPECKGGSTSLDNLVPICSRCNLSMGSQHTFNEWCNKGKKDPKWIQIIKRIAGVWKSSEVKVSGLPLKRNPMNQKGKVQK